MTHQAKDQGQPSLWDRASDADVDNAQVPRRTPPLLPAHHPAKPMEHQELWDIENVANYLGVPKQTIYSWRTTGYGPQGFRVGKHLRWRASTVIAWTLGLEQGN
jgi:predicted DNA-binding transcriptional regulator AlpA